MKKTLLSIEQELLDFLKSDAEKERRTMSAQMCALLELCQKYGGYSALVEKLTLNGQLKEMQEAQQKTTTRRVGRPRKKGKIKVLGPMVSCLYLALINKRSGRWLLVYAPDYEAATQYIVETLEAGEFPREDVQREFSEDCDSFTIKPVGGETPVQVREIYSDCVFYEGLLDLSHIGAGEPENAQEAAEQAEKPAKKKRTRRATLKQFMAIEWDDVGTDQVKQLYKKVASNKEVEAAVQKYIKDNMPSFYNPDPDKLEDYELLNVLQELQQDIYARQRGEDDGGDQAED